MTTAITLMEAYLIEYPLAKGMSKKELLQHLRANRADVLQEFVGLFDYNDLVEAFTQDENKISKAILKGYTIKFISITGIKQLLSLKFRLEAEKDFDIYEDKVLGIPFTKKQYIVFEEILSPNWKITKTELESGDYKVDVIHNSVV